MTVEVLLATFALVMLVQGLSNLWLTIWVWEDPERLAAIRSPEQFAPPRHRFTILLPARDEVAVIGETLRKLSEADYPADMLEFLVICEHTDRPTIEAARSAIDRHRIANAHVLVFDDGPINKPHGLNVGLAVASHEITTIFDSEDDVHPELFSVVDTIYQQDGPDVVQAGVQLMDYRSHWWSVHNVLEYYFWFKSRMHAHSRAGVVPLGGNTVFFRTQQVKDIGGWNEHCLTEDGEIGIRLSAAGARVHATYDARHVTREETPPTVKAFIKQRTRWNQGFLQIAGSGQWRRLRTRRQRALCLYLLAFPLAQAALLLMSPLLVGVGLFADVALLVSLVSWIPILVVLIQVAVAEVGLVMFCREQRLKFSVLTAMALPLTFLPYQVLLGVSALRAVMRSLKRQHDWEKTEHTGQHRDPDAVVDLRDSIGAPPDTHEKDKPVQLPIHDRPDLVSNRGDLR